MRFFQTCKDVCEPPELETLPAGAHPSAPLFCDAADHGVPIALLLRMDEEEREAAIRYGTHASANKEAEFINVELDEQVQAGNVAVFPLEAATALQNLWLSPAAVIPQVGNRPRLIFDSTWSRLNKIAERLSPMEAMHFRGTLHHILNQVLTANPRLGEVYLIKVDLEDAYIKFWVRMEDVPSVALLIPKDTPRKTHLVVFHLSLPIGYIDSAPYFCMATKTMSDLENEAISQRYQASNHPLEMADDYRAADNAGPPEAQANAIW